MHYKNLKIVFSFTLLLGLLIACEEETIDNYGTGTLTGKVVSNGLNLPIENVKISTNPVSTTVFTDADGNFEIEEIDVGEYSVQAEQNDYQTSFEAANIVANRTINVVFELDSIETGNLQPLKPSLLSPEDEAENISNEVDFVWSSSQNDDDEIVYTLELRNGKTNEAQLFEEIMDTVATVSNLEIGVSYFWQVTASDGVNAPVSSALASFQVQGVDGNRFLLVKNVNGNGIIFSGGEPVGQESTEIDQNLVQLTDESTNAYRPIANNDVDQIAYIATVGGENHLFTMNPDGTDKQQLTNTIPVAGFRQSEIEFAWYNNGQAIYYPNFNKLYSINTNGSANNLIYEGLSGEFITEVAVNPNSENVALKINDSNGYNVKIVILNPNNGQILQTVVSGIEGAFGGLDFSADGNQLLYTQDVSGTENNYRILDSRIFIYDLSNDTTSEFDTEKPVGQNNLDAKFSPDDGYIIYVQTSNDGISERTIKRTQVRLDGVIETETLFTNAFMPNWE